MFYDGFDLVVNFGIYDAVFSPPPQDIIVSGNLGDPKICLITAKILKWYDIYSNLNIGED